MAPTATSEFIAELHAGSEVKDIELSKLKTDYSYQRDISETLVDEIAANWDVVASELILVSNRGPRSTDSDVQGGYFIVNGQHRSKAAQKSGLSKIQARVIDLRKVEDPASIEAGFRLKTNVRISDRPLERYKAQLRAGDPRALHIKKILAQFDTEINQQTNTETGINAIVTIETIYDFDDGKLLKDVMELVRETWKVVGGPYAQSSPLKALAWFIDKHHKESDRTRLVAKLQGIGITAWSARAQTMRLTLGGSMWLNYYRALVDIYNDSLRDARRLQFKTRGSRSLARGGGMESGTSE